MLRMEGVLAQQVWAWTREIWSVTKNTVQPQGGEA